MDRKFSESYRLKLKNRLKSAKLKTQKKTTLEEVLQTQENQLKRDIESRLSSEWKKNISQELDTKFDENQISRDESLDFFFRSDSIDDKNDFKSEPIITTIERSGEEVIQIEEQDSRDSRLLVKDMFSSATNWSLFERNKSDFKSLKNRSKDENKYFMFPSNKSFDETNESLLKEESNNFIKLNEGISLKNLNKLKNRITAEGLKDKFLDQNSIFLDNNSQRIEIKNIIQIDSEFGSDKELIEKHKPSVGSFKEVFNYLFKRSDDLLIDGKKGSLIRKNERKILANLENLNADQLNQLIQQLKLEDSFQNNFLINTIDRFKRGIHPKSPQHSDESTPQESAKILEFCSDEELENNRRLKLLRLRSEGTSNFKNYRFVPINEKEIPLDLFEEKPKLDNTLSTERQFEEKREKSIEILTKIGEQLIKQSSGTVDRPRTLEDMVIEDDVSGISAMGFSIFPVSHMQRPLNPYRRERKKIAFNLIGSTDITIVITIMHSLNVPIRKKDNPSIGYGNGENDFSYESKVCPFVEAVFQRQSARTNTAEGTKPTWNETLSLRFRTPENECLPSNLAKISDSIYLNLFDEVLLDSDESITGDFGQKLIHKRTERRWLGSLRIPFSTLYLNSKIEGTFRLSTPLVLLGYEYDTKGWLLGADNSAKDISKQTYLTLFVTIDPSLQLPEPLVLKCDTIESESLLIYAKKWQNKFKEEFPNRSIKVLAIDMNTKSVLVSRYLRPLKPPEDFLANFNVTNDIMQRLARFVSLIPKVPDSIALPGICDIWCTCDQFLDMLLGDEEEHALLLCNYFLYLDKRAAILLGNGIPEGSTAYVIVFEYGRDPCVFNASTGEQFSVRDSYIPLNSIGCIITQENIFANISKSDHPNRLNYDINKSSDWRPFFGKNYSSPPILSIQPESLEYKSCDFENALKLQEKLEKHLRQSFMRWRKRSRTFFNRHVIQSIKKMLPRLESTGKIQVNDMIQELQDVLILHEMTGFPLNMPFTDFESITEAVFATGVHLAEDRRVEFALAVYVHPYPCSVFSVWVYVAALTRHSQL